MTQSNTSRNREATIAELLSDPIVHLLMASDGVKVRDIVAVVEQANRQRRVCATANAWHARAFVCPAA